MRKLLLDSFWLARRKARANQPAARDRRSLYVGLIKVGSVEPDFLDQVLLNIKRCSLIDLRREIHQARVSLRLLDGPTEVMALSPLRSEIQGWRVNGLMSN